MKTLISIRARAPHGCVQSPDLTYPLVGSQTLAPYSRPRTCSFQAIKALYRSSPKHRPTAMHVKHPQSALLSNHEVLLHLQAEQADKYGPDAHGRMRRMPKDLEEVVRDGIHYLTSPDYSTANLHAKHPTRPMTLYKGPNSLLRALAPKYRLNKAEYLQIYNIRPKSQITLQLVIEEATMRFKEHELEDILAIITRVFDEEEAEIPEGVEDMEMEKLDTKLLGAKKGRKMKKKA